MVTGPMVMVKIGLRPDAERALRDAGQPIPEAIELPAMIDTGASFTVIKQSVGTELGLKPVGVKLMSTANQVNIPCDQYAVRMALPNNVLVGVTATEAPMPNPEVQALIGRDILSRGVLIYIGPANTFTLSF